MQTSALFLFAAIILAFGEASSANAAPPLSVPFTSQAPRGNWTSPWKDYCEEASVVMAAHFLWRMPISPEIADFEMGLVRQFEIAAFGRWRDTDIEETTDILRQLYGFSGIRTAVITSAEDIQKELSAGKIVIAPTAGRLLKNPYFTPPGPAYHMIVIKGFDEGKEEFIVNDPGTRRGEGLRYPADVLFGAIHDLHETDILQGEKRVIIVGR